MRVRFALLMLHFVLVLILFNRLIKRFSPNECIVKNEGHTKFAYVSYKLADKKLQV
jgi:hypothetical protein